MYHQKLNISTVRGEKMTSRSIKNNQYDEFLNIVMDLKFEPQGGFLKNSKEKFILTTLSLCTIREREKVFNTSFHIDENDFIVFKLTDFCKMFKYKTFQPMLKLLANLAHNKLIVYKTDSEHIKLRLIKDSIMKAPGFKK